MPTAYLEGYARAAGVDRALADRYVAATRIGDPEADALMAELQRHNPVDAQSWIARGSKATHPPWTMRRRA